MNHSKEIVARFIREYPMHKYKIILCDDYYKLTFSINDNFFGFVIDDTTSYNILVHRYKNMQINKCDICDDYKKEFISCYKCCYKFCSDCAFEILLNYNKIDCPQCRLNLIVVDNSIDSEKLNLLMKIDFYQFI